MSEAARVEAAALAPPAPTPEPGGGAARDIVLFGPADWRVVQSLPEWTLEGLVAKGHRVLVVEPLGNVVSLVRTAFWQRRKVKKAFGLRKEREGLWVYSPAPLGVPETSRAASVARANARHLVRGVRRAMAELGFEDAILWTFLYTVGETLERLPGSLKVYESGDADLALAVSAAQRRTGEALEGELLRAADLVMCCTEELAVPRRRVNPNSHEVPCGVDPVFFGQALDGATAVPADIAALKGPVIGYMVGLDPWKIDVDLLLAIARARPDWSLALVGFIWFGFDPTPLRAAPNIHILGPKPYADFPGYLKGMDVGLLPFPLNDITKNGDALKAYEYLAAGLPVVGRNVPVARRLAPTVRIADTAEEFVSAIDAALFEGEGAVAHRTALAARHCWSVRVARKLELIDAALAHREGAAGAASTPDAARSAA